MNLTKRKVVSTFSGCGGSCQGFKIAGFTPVFASEFIPAAREVYMLNNPGVPCDGRDIRDLTAQEILEVTGLKVGELDVLEGSPPCSAFSMSGKRESGWGEVKAYSSTTQRVDDLFFEFIRLVEGLKPKVFVAENVPGLASGNAKGYLKEILVALKAIGYQVECKILCAANYGVPQSRNRLIFIGVRDDLGVKPRFPSIKSTVKTIREALHGLNDPGDFQKLKAGLKLRYVYDRAQRGESFDKALSRRSKSKVGKYFNHVRTHFDAPCPTICASCAGIYHPDEPRTFGINELKRLASFPDSYKFTGSFAQRWERIGRSVPPLMMAAIASEVAQILEESNV